MYKCSSCGYTEEVAHNCFAVLAARIAKLEAAVLAPTFTLGPKTREVLNSAYESPPPGGTRSTNVARETARLIAEWLADENVAVLAWADRIERGDWGRE